MSLAIASPTLLSRRVTPDAPAGRALLSAGPDNAEAATDRAPDDTSALSFFLHYGGGTLSGGRRISLRRIDAQGSVLLGFLGFCHERRAVRSFAADRVEEAVDLATGEVLDCKQFRDFVMTRANGLVERRLFAMANMLVSWDAATGR